MTNIFIPYYSDDEYGLVLEGDTYCIKHRELYSVGLDVELSCGFCEWGDE